MIATVLIGAAYGLRVKWVAWTSETLTRGAGTDRTFRVTLNGERIVVSHYDKGDRHGVHTVLRVADLAVVREFKGIMLDPGIASPNRMVLLTPTEDVEIWNRTREESWRGLLARHELWLTVILSFALLWSLRKDWTGLPQADAAEPESAP